MPDSGSQPIKSALATSAVFGQQMLNNARIEVLRLQKVAPPRRGILCASRLTQFGQRRLLIPVLQCFKARVIVLPGILATAAKPITKPVDEAQDNSRRTLIGACGLPVGRAPRYSKICSVHVLHALIHWTPPQKAVYCVPLTSTAGL